MIQKFRSQNSKFHRKVGSLHAWRWTFQPLYLIFQVIALCWKMKKRSEGGDYTMSNCECSHADCRPYSLPYFLIRHLLACSLCSPLVGSLAAEVLFLLEKTKKHSPTYTLFSQNKTSVILFVLLQRELVLQSWLHHLYTINWLWQTLNLYPFLFFPLGSTQYCRATMTPYSGNQTRQWV